MPQGRPPVASPHRNKQTDRQWCGTIYGGNLFLAGGLLHSTKDNNKEVPFLFTSLLDLFQGFSSARIDFIFSGGVRVLTLPVLCPLPWNNYIIADRGLFVNTFFKSYFFHNVRPGKIKPHKSDKLTRGFISVSSI